MRLYEAKRKEDNGLVSMIRILCGVENVLRRQELSFRNDGALALLEQTRVVRGPSF